jgi:hypothetical protein
MSHTFDVYPGHLSLPTFGELLKTAQERISTRAGEMGLHVDIKLRATLRTDQEPESIVQLADGPFKWPAGETTYVWFEAIGVDGGCDVTYAENRDEIETFRDEVKHSKRLPDEFVDRCLDFGQRWTFRRSAGQPCLVALLYGYLAAALAELTEGLIYSDDGAWDPDMLPMRSSEFYETYFRPERTKNHTEWVTRCLTQIPFELSADSRSATT